jgi:hypothetical protein
MGKIIVFLVFFGLIFSTCRKDDESFCTDDRTTQILSHQRDFFYFKTGSWWVYEEEKTGEKDSIWVASDTHERFRGHPEIMFSDRRCTEQYQMSFLNKDFNNLDSSVYLQLTIASSFIRGDYVVEEVGEAVGSGYLTRIAYRNDIQDTTRYPNGHYAYLSSVDVKGKTYADILHLYYKPKPAEDKGIIQDWLHEAWYAKNIYLVKFTKSDSTTWNLIKYNIIK